MIHLTSVFSPISGRDTSRIDRERDWHLQLHETCSVDRQWIEDSGVAYYYSMGPCGLRRGIQHFCTWVLLSTTYVFCDMGLLLTQSRLGFAM